MAERIRSGRTRGGLRRKMAPLAAFVALADAGLCTVLARVDALVGDVGNISDGRDGPDRRHRPDSPDPGDMEAIHALRVAVRHLRAVAWAFQPVVADAVRARWKSVLRDTADACGETRDWDVFVAETLAPALEREPAHPVLLALIDAARTRRAAAHDVMMTKLSRDMRPRLGTLEDDVRRLVRTLRKTTSATRKRRDKAMRLDAFAQRRVRKARRHVRALARTARDGQTEHVHRLRIGNKRLRYAIEALADVLPRRLRKRLHKKLVRRQTALGTVVDDAVARRLLCECLTDLRKYGP
ncbi:CHAD domain-containing protein [Cupriavidus pauculus]|uniref:CHAD domain-containing protein n=2 Tax=Cupriavidus pauculus TaxID=82633 RepID=A0A5P2H961_9BURK|nr:CHAD domain-containing protein [Cupriavidus pauculus]